MTISDKRLVKNEDGSYTVNATKLDVKNESNQIWESLPVKAILDDAESSFRIKLKEGGVYSNWGIPVPPEDLNNCEQFEFYTQTNLEDICAVILDCTLNEDNTIEVSFRPYGSKGHLLQALIDKGVTPTFGLRSIGTVSYTEKYTQIVSVEEIISFDLIIKDFKDLRLKLFFPELQVTYNDPDVVLTDLENMVITQTPVSEETPEVFEEPPTNFKCVSDSIYIVRTQAGFKGAVKHYASSQGYSDFEDVFGYLEGYPKSYPSLVSFATEYQGYHYVRAECVHVNTLTKAIEESENVLSTTPT